MKKYLFIPALLFAALVFFNFNIPAEPGYTFSTEREVVIPEDVQAIIDNSCYGCHYSGSKNIKGKGKLKFDELDELKTHKLVGKLGKVAETVEEDDMPPKKFLSKNPDKALTAEQKQLLINWAESTAKKYTGE